MNCTPGNWVVRMWSAPTGGGDFDCVAAVFSDDGKGKKEVAFIQELHEQEENAYLIAAAPVMFKEIQETRERLDVLLKKLRGNVDEDTMIALATMEMDLNRAAAIADGSWPGVRESSVPKERK